MVVTWKRGKAVMGLMKTPFQMTPPETLGVSDADSLEYDLASRPGFHAYVSWLSKNANGRIALTRQIGALAPFALSAPETLSVPSTLRHMHLVTSGYQEPSFLYESQDPFQTWQVWAWTGWPVNVSSDPLADNLNARGWSTPYVMKTAAPAGALYFPYNVCVYERYSQSDSGLVFHTAGGNDTVRSGGYNRSACVGSQLINLALMVVWESNRSGRSHIYSRLVPALGDDAVTEKTRPGSRFSLAQNYPNPFNGQTTIRYQVPSSGHVRLQVFDLLGREIALLVNGLEEPGSHTVTFDGSRVSSGVYLYRLSAGGFIRTRTMLVLK